MFWYSKSNLLTCIYCIVFVKAVKTAVNAICPIEPFKLFHRIGENTRQSKPELERLKLERAEQVSIPGRSNQPVGMAQIGFACFWPNGGGLLPSKTAPRIQTDAQPSVDIETKPVEAAEGLESLKE